MERLVLFFGEGKCRCLSLLEYKRLWDTLSVFPHRSDVEVGEANKGTVCDTYQNCYAFIYLFIYLFNQFANKGR